MCELLCQRCRCSHTVVTPGRLGCRPRRLIGVSDVCQMFYMNVGNIRAETIVIQAYESSCVWYGTKLGWVGSELSLKMRGKMAGMFNQDKMILPNFYHSLLMRFFLFSRWCFRR